MTYREYVLGFAFNQNKDKVLLILKNRPHMNQVEVYNGIGGKIEDGETSIQAMKREFKEETGLSITDWTPFCNFGDMLKYTVRCFYTSSDDIFNYKETTDEKLEIFDVNNLPENLMYNLDWTIPMALSFKGRFYDIIESGEMENKQYL